MENIKFHKHIFSQYYMNEEAFLDIYEVLVH